MAYCTQDDLLERIPENVLIELTDDEDSGEVDTSRVDRAIADADAVIDGYVGKRYTVPRSPVPDLLRKVSVELAIYGLFTLRLGAPDEWRQRYEDNRRLLESIAKGLVSLGADEPDGTPTGVSMDVDSKERQFSRDTLEGF